MIRYLIWDAGGTLFDTYPATVTAFGAALQAVGHTADPEWVLALCRRTTAHCIRTLAKTYSISPETLESRFRSHYRAIGPEAQPPFPGVERICHYIWEVGGQNFVVTHRGRASLTRLLATHGLAAYVTDCVTKEDPYPRKPDPSAILALVTRYALDRDRGLVVGDRDIDVQAGRAAGIRTVFFGEEAHPTPATIEIDVYDELYRLILAENQGGIS